MEKIMDDPIERNTGTEEATPLNELKVVFLGDSGAGKSHILARTMMDGGQTDFFRGESTPGIVIKDKIYNIGSRNIRVHFWDFGGQENLHPLHRIFLTKQALYVVVLSAREGNLDDRASYWLRYIESSAGPAPVLLVLNKIDENRNPTINANELKGKYPQLGTIVKLSTIEYSREEFVHSFIDPLLQNIDASDYLDARFPPAWHRLMQMLQSMYDNYILGNHFRDFCDHCGIENSDDVRLDLLNWLQSLGVCFCISNGRTLEDYLIMRPDWVINAVYSIVFNRPWECKNGVLSHEAIYRMLSDTDSQYTHRTIANISYYADEVHYLLTVFRKFHLSFAVDESHEFIPMLCDADSAHIAEEYASDPDTPEFRMRYAYLPNNVIHQLMVERLSELDLDNVWLTGARFIYENSGISAVVKREGDLLRILVRSDGLSSPQMYLDLLKNDLERISADMGLTITNTEVAYKQSGMVEFFDYEDLLLARELGDTSVRSKVLKKRIPLADILHQSGNRLQEQQHRLILDIGKACGMLRKDKEYDSTYAQIRTDYLRQSLVSKYMVGNRHLLRIIRYAAGPGNIDLDIRLNDDTPIAYLAALNIQGNGAAFMEDWDDRRSNLLRRAYHSDHNTYFLVSYMACTGSHFSRILNDYSSHIRRYEPKAIKCLPDTFRPVPTEINDPYVQIMQCSYDTGRSFVTVYYYFVLMGDEVEQDAPPVPQLPEVKPDVSAIKPEEPDVKPKVPDPVPAAPALPEIPAVEDDDTPVLYEYPVVLLGDSEAGKSHILARLKNPELKHTAFFRSPDKPGEEPVFSGDTTEGIDVASMTYPIGGKQVRLNYWDFGGQEILHSMQRLFMVRQALYVIVLNTRNDNHDVQADFWLSYLNTYAPMSPVILVLNKLDQNPGATLNLAMLRRRFRDVMKDAIVLRMSARDWSKQQFQTEFINVLTDRVGQLLSRDCGFTARELRIRDQLYQTDGEPLIGHGTFLSVCKKEGLTDKDKRKSLYKRFTQSGILTRFKSDTSNLLIPAWITTALFKLLKKRDDLTRNGTLSREDLIELYLDAGYKNEHVNFILSVMRDTDLSFSCNSLRDAGEYEDREFIPMLCSREEPPEIEAMERERNPVEVQMHFDYLPPSVLHQLMVERRNELDITKAWLSGAIFRSDTGCTAVVRRDGNILTIQVWGNKPAYTMAYLDVLRKRIPDLALSDMHNAIVREVRIGFQLGSTMEYFNHKRLTNAKACGIQYTANSGNLHERIAVLDILEQEDRSESRNLEQLLRITLTGCMELQDDQTFWFRGKAMKELEKYLPKMDENARNRQLRRTLGSSFIVKDQTQSGESSTGRSPGELDLAIYIEKDIHWSIMEALNITGTDSDSEKRWNEHLHRMMEHYNKKGLRHLILISYLNCPEDQLNDVDAHYFKQLQGFIPAKLGSTQTRCERVHMDNCPKAIRISRADYTGGRGAVSVFHFLVHIPEICEPHTQLVTQ